MKQPYKRYPPEPPRVSRGLWWLAAVLALVLVANLVHQTL